MNPVNRRVSLVLAIGICAFALSAQTTSSPAASTPAVPVAATIAAAVAPTTNAAPAPVYPSYFISAGGGYTRNATPNAAEGTVSAAIGLGGGNYSITTIDMYSAYSSVRTGFGKIMAQSGNMTLLARIDAGISTGTPVIGNFSGGAILMYNLAGIKPTLKNTYVYGEVRLTGATAATPTAPAQVTPGFYFGVGRAF